ncbi:azurin [bacterium]|nr:azurin [bacterium]
MRTLAAFTLIPLLVACGQAETPSPDASETASETPVTPVHDGPRLFRIEANDQMKYNLEMIEVQAGEAIQLTLVNVGSMPVEAMGHNWTLLAKDVDADAYAMEAMKYKDNGYQVPDQTDNVLITTKILGPGEEETIAFTVPTEPGPYKFLCTFPGHYGSMKGILFVKS